MQKTIIFNFIKKYNMYYIVLEIKSKHNIKLLIYQGKHRYTPTINFTVIINNEMPNKNIFLTYIF